MAKKKTSKTTTSFEFKGYANVLIPEADGNKVAAHIKDAQAVYEEINTLAKDGYSVKVYYNDDDGNFRASLTCMNPEDSNFGYVLASYAQDWFTAVAVLTFKHFDVTKENWQEYTTAKTNSFG